MVLVFRDFSQQKAAEKSLHRLNRTLTALSSSSQALMRARDEAEYLDEVLLAAEGHTVVGADSVSTALVTAEAQTPDLIISDLGLPDGSGHDLMRQLRANKCKAKGIALSGYGMEEDLRKSREAGFAEHLTKPVDVERLQAAIARVIQP